MSKLIDFPKKGNHCVISNKAGISEIALYGIIGESMWEEGISAKAFLEELKKVPQDTKEIHLRINSPGGSVFDGITMYSRLKEHKAKVKVFVDGIAASIASIIMLAGDEISISDGGFVMIHKPLTGVYGNADEMEKMISVLDKIESQMIGIYMKKMKKSSAEISRLLTAETYLTAQEALDLGIVDNIMGASSQLKVAAHMAENTPWLKGAPKITLHNDLVRAKINDFTNDISNYLNKK